MLRVSGIMGSSGSGKSHASQLYCNCDSSPPVGAFRWSGYSTNPLRGRLLQSTVAKLVILFRLPLLDNLTGRKTSCSRLPCMVSAESSQRLKQLADYLEITDVLDKFPSKMSGGQRQRVAAARALILHPQMILADEPTGALDSKNARSLMEKLSGLNRDEQATILMVTHDSNAASFCSASVHREDGVIFHGFGVETASRSSTGTS